MLPAIPWLTIMRSKWLYIGLLILALGVQTARFNNARAEAENFKLAYTTLKTATFAAQKAAEANQIALNIATQGRQKAIAELKANDYRNAQDRARIAFNHYSERMQLPPGCTPSQSDTAPADDPARDSDKPGPQTEYVAVAKDDLEIMIENSVRMQQVKAWGDALIADGLAVAIPGPEF